MRFVAGRGAVAKLLVRGAAVAERHREEAAGKGAHKNHNREKLAGKSAQKPRFCAREEEKVASGSVTVVWNAKPWPGMQTRGPKMQEGGLNLGHPLGWLRERCERCAANGASVANDALRTMRCRRSERGSEGALVVLLQVLCYRVGDEGESIHVPSLRPVGVNLCRFLH